MHNINKIMIQKRSKKKKVEHLKTESISQTQITLMEFGKPVKLPNIHKKIHRYQNDTTNSRSIQAPNSLIHNQSFLGKPEEKNEGQAVNLRKYSNNSQFNLLTLQQMELCSQRSKKFLPKIAGLANCFASTRQNTDYFDRQQFMRRLSRMKSEKNIQTTSYEQLSNYKFDCILGRGSYSIVKLAYGNNGKKYAVKIYGKHKINCPEREENLARQIKIMKQIQHPNIIRFKEHIETQDQTFLVMELFDNCSLSDYQKKKINSEKIIESKNQNETKTLGGATILMHGKKKQKNNSVSKDKKKVNQNVVKNIFLQIAGSISYLHQKGIVHRDIKLDNVLIETTENKIKLIDFGFSCYDDKNIMHKDYCGTPNYISPEILKKQGYRGKPADIWALGVLLFHLIVGYYPFKAPSEQSDFKTIQMKSPHNFSEELLSLLEHMLINNPDNRYSIDQVLKSKWLINK